MLSAIEGLEVAAPALEDYVIPITLAILVVLFAIQRKGHGDGRFPIRAGDDHLVHHPCHPRP